MNVLVVLFIGMALMGVVSASLLHFIVLPKDRRVNRNCLIYLYGSGTLSALVPASLFAVGAVGAGWPAPVLWGIGVSWAFFAMVGATVVYLHWEDGRRGQEADAATMEQLWHEINTLREEVLELGRRVGRQGPPEAH